MRQLFLLFLLFTTTVKAMPLIKISQEYLAAIRYDQDVECYLRELAEATQEDLSKQLDTDTKKKVFWINVYNATVQYALKEDSDQYKKRMAFYGKQRITVAGKVLSLNDIEHGLLRKSQWIYGQGNVRKWFPGAFEKTNRVDALDVRVHFALNCGAKSCPPILFYTATDYDAQIDLATKGFLSETSLVKAEVLELSKLFFYYSGDFGGKAEKIALVKKHTKLNGLENIKKIKYSDYDWTMHLDMFR